MKHSTPLSFWRMLPFVVGGSVVAVLGLWLVRLVVPIESLRPSNNEAGNYLQAVGTIYAVLLAFVVYVVWGQFNEARSQVEREASEIIDLYRTADGFPEESRRKIQLALRDYVGAILEREWRAMAANDEAEIESVNDILDRVWDVLHNFEPRSECHKSLLGETLSRYNELSDVRTSRLTAARLRIPPALWMLLGAGAFITVASMYLLAVDRFLVHALMTAALGGAVSHILYIIWDLDDAFAGDWQVPRDEMERARRYILRREPVG